MKLNVAKFSALVGLTCMVALGADIDGKWTATTQGRNGPQTQTLTLKAEGEMLTGTLAGGRGGAVQISDGMISGNDVSFKVVREFNGNQITQQYKGTLSGDELKLTVDTGRGNPREMTFKRGEGGGGGGDN